MNCDGVNLIRSRHDSTICSTHEKRQHERSSFGVKEIPAGRGLPFEGFGDLVLDF